MCPTMPTQLRRDNDPSVSPDRPTPSDVRTGGFHWTRGLRVMAGPQVRTGRLSARSWTTVAAFLCGGAGAIPFALESHVASASTPFVSATDAAAVAHLAAVATTAPPEHVAPPAQERPAEAKLLPPTREIERPVTPPAKRAEGASFNGRPVRAVRTVTMRVTAYSPDERSCGSSADNITASGYSVWTNGGRLVAADTSILPLGSMVSIPGYDAGAVVPVLDRGSAIKGNRLDVLFPTHEQAKRWGVRDLKITIYEYADGEPNDFRENHWSRPGRDRSTRLTDASPS